MKFDTPATTNPIDQLKVVGHPTPRIDGPFKTTGTARYAYERHDVAPDAAYGVVVGAAVGKGRIAAMDLAAAQASPGVLAIVTARSAGKLGKGKMNTAHLLGGPDIQHYHQAVALVVAETFEQARAAAQLRARSNTRPQKGKPTTWRPPRIRRCQPEGRRLQRQDSITVVGDFDGAYAGAPVRLDSSYTTPDQSHSDDGAARHHRRNGMQAASSPSGPRTR